jgi:hypothetical protein
MWNQYGIECPFAKRQVAHVSHYIEAMAADLVACLLERSFGKI